MSLRCLIKKIPGVYRGYWKLSSFLPHPFDKLSIDLWPTYFWFRDSQWYSQKQIQDYQNKKLKRIIEQAYANIPYYTKIFNERGLKPKDVQCKEDLKKLKSAQAWRTR